MPPDTAPSHASHARGAAEGRGGAERSELEQFLIHEAQLLDQRRFRDWMGLFAEDGSYWVPAVPGQKSPFDQASLFYDDRELMRTRIERLEHPRIHVRVIKPVAVDRTEVTIYPIRLLGAPAEMNAGNIRLLNVTHAAASFVQTDDLESFVRAQKGLASTLTDWVDISRGLGDEEPDRELNATRGLATHEMVVRAQYKAWLGYMREAA